MTTEKNDDPKAQEIKSDIEFYKTLAWTIVLVGLLGMILCFGILFFRNHTILGISFYYPGGRHNG